MYIPKKRYNIEWHDVIYFNFSLLIFFVNFYVHQKKYLHIFENPLMGNIQYYEKNKNKKFCEQWFAE